MELIVVRVRDAVRTAFVDDELASLDQLLRGTRGGVDRHDLIVRLMNRQSTMTSETSTLPRVALE
jgi:hypothetical protein